MAILFQISFNECPLKMAMAKYDYNYANWLKSVFVILKYDLTKIDGIFSRDEKE